MRAVFLGNHTVGVTVLRALAETGTLAGVVAHPPDPEDGVRYLSVYDQAGSLGVPRLRARGKDAELAPFLEACRPDVLVVADYRYLLPRTVLQTAPWGGVNFHPSLLPAYRGRAPINWAILQGETELGLSVHAIDDGLDTGDIVAQRRYALAAHEDVGDALDKLYPLYDELARETMAALEAGSLPRRPQDHARATVFPRRRPEDGLLDFGREAQAVVNLVRAVARPYPGAFAWSRGTRVTVWKARALDGDGGDGLAPGQVASVAPGQFAVRCGRGMLLVLDWEADTADFRPETAERFDLPGAAQDPGEITR